MRLIELVKTALVTGIFLGSVLVVYFTVEIYCTIKERKSQ